MKSEFRKIRASFNDKSIEVYQAYSNEIADSALQAGKFISPPFKMNQMSWIKLSFLRIQILFLNDLIINNQLHIIFSLNFRNISIGSDRSFLTLFSLISARKNIFTNNID